MRKKIVVMEDDEIIRSIISEILTNVDYEVNAPENLAELHTYLETNTPDLLITDIFMPEINGIEVMPLCRRHNYNIYIIAISGGDMSGNESRDKYLRAATELGADAILKKPFIVGDLIFLVDNIFKNNKIRD